MKPERRDQLLKEFRTNPPASCDLIVGFEQEAGIHLPAEYREFLAFSNGGEGFIGPGSYAVLWRIEELLTFNRDYRAHEFAPGLLLFGSNGGGEAFAFDCRIDGTLPIGSIPFIGMNLEDLSLMGGTFDEFVEYIARH